MKIFLAILALVAVSSASPQLGSLGGMLPGGGGMLPGGGGSSSGSGTPPKQDTNTGTGSDSNCPLGCPPGWVRWGFSEHCYHLPNQPALLNTFWHQADVCKKTEPTSYLVVSNSVIEQVLGSAIAIQYAPSWFLYATNAYFWLGGYIQDGKWIFMDGTDPRTNPFFIAAGLTSMVNMKNNTCLGADTKTLGIWQTYPCDTPGFGDRGAALCEMPMRPVCGEQGGILPISGVDLNRDALKNMFPSMYNLPYLDQLLGAFKLFGLGSSVSDSQSTNYKPTPNKDCVYGCPAGWYSWDSSSTNDCYFLPEHNIDWNQGGKTAQRVTYAQAERACKSLDPSAYVMVINDLMEAFTTKAILNKLRWGSANDGYNLWLGERTANRAWTYSDGSENKGNLPMSMANLPSRKPGTFQGTKCLATGLNNGERWREVDCETSNLYFCEMPKQMYCKPREQGGKIIEQKYFPADFTMETLRFLFPNIPPTLPFLEELLQGKGQNQPVGSSFDILAGIKNMVASGGAAQVICVRDKGEWTYLKIKGETVTFKGQWISTNCQKSTVFDGFSVSAGDAVSAWSRCYNNGYELAMPLSRNAFDAAVGSTISDFVGKFKNWSPFIVGDKVAAHYSKARATGFNLLDQANVFASIQQYDQGTVGNC